MKETDTMPHILNTSSNLMGLCFFVVTYFKASNIAAKTYIDDVVGIVAIIFAFSCLYSFLSMRNSNLKKKERYETVADILFFSGISIFVCIIIGSFFWIF